MYFDQLLTISLLFILLFIKLFITFYPNKLVNFFKNYFKKWNILNIFFTMTYNYIYFYLFLLAYYIICTFTLTKWVSANYSDAYWSLYSCKLDQQINNLRFKY